MLLFFLDTSYCGPTVTHDGRSSVFAGGQVTGLCARGNLQNADYEYIRARWVRRYLSMAKFLGDPCCHCNEQPERSHMQYGGHGIVLIWHLSMCLT